MAYQSGEIVVNKALGNWTEVQPATVIFNNKVYQMTALGRNRQITLVQTTFELGKLISQTPATPDEPVFDDGLKNQDNWVSANLNIRTGPGRPGLAALPVSEPDTLFTFYCNGYYSIDMSFSSTGILASRFPLNDQNQGRNNNWSQPINLLDSDGINMPLPYGSGNDIDTTTIGDNIVIIACSSASPQPKSNGQMRTNPTAAGTFVGVYDKSKINFSSNEWKAEFSTYIPYGQGISPYISRVAVEWYCKVGEVKDKDGNRVPEYHLLVALPNGDTSKNPVMSIFVAPMTLTENGNVSLGGFGAITGPFTFANNQAPASPFFMGNLVRDAAGRLRAWMGSSNNVNQLTAYIIDVAATPAAGITFTATSDSFSSDTKNFYRPSASVFYTATLGQYTTTEKAPIQGAADLTAHNYPVYEFIFYGHMPRCQVKRVATIKTFTDPKDNRRELKKKDDESHRRYIIGGIFNGPIPFPIVNYAYDDKGGDLSAGKITYGSRKAEISSRKSEKSLTIGLEMEAKVTKGIGPAISVSFKSGMGSVQENSVETDIVHNLSQDASIEFNPDTKTVESASGGMIKTLSASMKLTAFNYIDFYGVSIDSTSGAQTNGIKAGAIEIGFADSGNPLIFTPYNVTPGDLESYKPEAINKRMNELGYDGKALGYTGDNNYFGDVICQNALPMEDADYLEMAWTSSGTESSAFSSINTSFKETNWTLDASLYAGVSGGAGFNLFGLGEEFEFSMMAGVDLSRSNSVSEETELEWGIEIDESWGPEKNGAPTAVKKYVFRVYFLPPPSLPSILPQNYWTRELLAHLLPADKNLAAQIDANSACWQIFYAVTEIEYNNGTSWIYEPSTLDKSSVYGNATARRARLFAEPEVEV